MFMYLTLWCWVSRCVVSRLRVFAKLLKVKVTLRLTVGQSVSQSVCLSWSWSDISYCLVIVGRPLWLEDGSVICQSAKLSQSQSHIATEGQSVCLSWCRKLLSCSCGGALSDERTGLSFVRVTVSNISQLSICTIIYIFLPNVCIYSIYKTSCQSRLSTADYGPISSSFPYNGSVVTWTVGLRLVQCCEHFHYHDFVWLLLVAVLNWVWVCLLYCVLLCGV
jgi:hypothetical protein